MWHVGEAAPVPVPVEEHHGEANLIWLLAPVQVEEQHGEANLEPD